MSLQPIFRQLVHQKAETYNSDLRRNKPYYQKEQGVNVISEILEKRPTVTISIQLNFTALKFSKEGTYFQAGA